MKRLIHIERKTRRRTFVVISMLVLIVHGCEKTEPDYHAIKSTEQQITEYIIARDSIYSEFKKAMDISNMSSLLSTRGPYTLFLPDNKAMKAYYSELGIQSIEEKKDSLFWRSIVFNHLIPGNFGTGDIPLGSFPQKNGLGDYMIADIEVVDVKGYYIINKESYITDENEFTANGVIHRIDKVIKLTTKTIPEKLEQYGSFTIFLEGLARSGIKDTLNKITVPYGKIDVRTRYTVLAVPDSVYIAQGINDVEGLIARYDDGKGELTDLTNGFYKYMDNHCLEESYYTNYFINNVYPTISREGLVNIRKEGLAVKINAEPNMEESTEIIVGGSNIPAKNGAIHIVNTPLEVVEFSSQTIHFEMTDFPDIMALDCYLTKLRNFTSDGQTTFKNLKWKIAPYLQYYFKSGEPFSRNEGIVMAEGYWELEATIPKIKKGKYHVISRFKKGGNRANLAVYIDGVRKEDVIILNNEFGYQDFPIFDVDWATTTEHTVKLKTVTPGIVMWDYLEFVPIE